VVEQGISTSAGIHTWSVFAKAQNLNFLIINAFSGSSNRTWFNLSNGTIGTNAAGSTATITNYGNGWYRCSVTRNYTSGSFLFVAQTAPSDGVFSYTGSVNGIYLWGAQVEAGSYPTSYIPTLGSSVTRLADVASKTGISSLIGQSEGVLFVDFVYSGKFGSITNASMPVSIDDASGTDEAYIFIQGGTNIASGQFVVGSAFTCNITGLALTIGTRYKMAFAYKQNDFAFYINGALQGVDTSGNIAPFSNLRVGNYLGGNYIQDTIDTVALYTTRLSNAELQSLTTL
jgi:hypothetical protein